MSESTTKHAPKFGLCIGWPHSSYQLNLQRPKLSRKVPWLFSGCIAQITILLYTLINGIWELGKWLCPLETIYLCQNLSRYPRGGNGTAHSMNAFQVICLSDTVDYFRCANMTRVVRKSPSSRLKIRVILSYWQLSKLVELLRYASMFGIKISRNLLGNHLPKKMFTSPLV